MRPAKKGSVSLSTAQISRSGIFPNALFPAELCATSALSFFDVFLLFNQILLQPRLTLELVRLESVQPTSKVMVIVFGDAAVRSITRNKARNRFPDCRG